MPQHLTDHYSVVNIGAVRQAAITWANVDLDPCRIWQY